MSPLRQAVEASVGPQAGRTPALARTNMVVGRIEVDPMSRTVRSGGVPIALTRLEFDLLLRLALEPGRVFTKRELLRDVWGRVCAGRTLERHAQSLRRKLGPSGRSLVTVWGVGYRLDPH